MKIKENDRLIRNGYKAIDAETGMLIDIPKFEVTVVSVEEDGVGFRYQHDQDSKFRPGEIWSTRLDLTDWEIKNEK